MKIQRYDFIILGAGTSGCYLAERLSRDSTASILLVEAGIRSKNPMLSMPAGYTLTLFDDKYNWCFDSEPEAQLNSRSVYCPRGKLVGGSSMINGMIHSIGQSEDYDAWESDGFSLSNSQGVMSAYRELFPEGEMISRSESHPLESIFLSACEQAGLTYADKLHESQSTLSAGTYFNTIRDGKRNGVTPILARLHKRKNVTVMTDTLIDKLCFDNDKVCRVEAIQKGKKTIEIPVSGELVLCLGAIGTPAVLQRSGIGATEKLSQLDIDTYLDLPCGENLQDHLLVKRTYKLSGIKTYNSDVTPTALPKTLLNYSIGKKGVFAAGASSAGAFVSVVDQERPDTQVFFSYGSVTIANKAFVADPFDGVTIGTYQLRPESRGCVDIRSKNPLEAPQIHYNYLSNERDWEVTRAGVEYQESLMRRDAFTPFKPEAMHAELSTDDYIRQFGETAHHPVGTCAVGENGVVEGNLKVNGLRNLRIADASIIPRIISGNTQAVCAVIGDLVGQDMLSRS